MSASRLAHWTTEDLREAEPMQLMWEADSEAARSLIAALTPLVEDAERAAGRKKRRGHKDLPKLQLAIGAIVADLLRAIPKASYRSLHKAYFAHQRIAYDQFDSASNSLMALGLIDKHPSTTIPKVFGFDTKAARMRPTQALMELSAGHGVYPGTIKETFRLVPNKGRPKPPPDVLEVRLLPEPAEARAAKRKAAVLVTIPPDNRARIIRRHRIEKANAIAARHDIEGCLTPVWRAVHRCISPEFDNDWSLGGRWFAVGWGGAYWRLNEAARAAIRIDGEAVTEIDVSGSQISLLHGHLGLPAPVGPYDFLEFPKDPIKQFVIQTLGNGCPHKDWPRAVAERFAEFPFEAVKAAVLTRYPFLEEPSVVLPPHYKGLARRRQVLTHWLMGLEAGALSSAIERLWERHPEALAMPVFDSLIVPVSLAEDAKVALKAAYRDAGLGIEVALKEKAAAEGGDMVDAVLIGEVVE